MVLGVEMANLNAGHYGMCAYGAGGDCTCGRFPLPELVEKESIEEKKEPPLLVPDHFALYDDDIPFSEGTRAESLDEYKVFARSSEKNVERCKSFPRGKK